MSSTVSASATTLLESTQRTLKEQSTRTYPVKSNVEQVENLPDWANFKVLAFEATADELSKMMANVYSLRKDSMTASSFKIHVGAAALLFLRARTGLKPKLFTRGMHKGARDTFLLSFCSSVILPQDPSFFANEVMPTSPDMLQKIKAIGKLIGNEELPRWLIPDQAMTVEELISELISFIEHGVC